MFLPIIGNWYLRVGLKKNAPTTTSGARMRADMRTSEIVDDSASGSASLSDESGLVVDFDWVVESLSIPVFLESDDDSSLRVSGSSAPSLPQYRSELEPAVFVDESWHPDELVV
jgi:hypothetical protein